MHCPQRGKIYAAAADSKEAGHLGLLVRRLTLKKYRGSQDVKRSCPAEREAACAVGLLSADHNFHGIDIRRAQRVQSIE